MFNLGEKVVYGSSGVYIISEITTLNSAGVDKSRLYYCLKNIATDAVAYVPTDSEIYLRPVMSRNEAEALFASIPSIPATQFSASNPKELPRICKEIISSHDHCRIIGLIKYLKLSEKKKLLQRKKLSITEERYLGQSLMVLSAELGEALNISKAELENKILDMVS